MIELMGNLAEEHVSGLAGRLGREGAIEWRDVGIWSEKQWVFMTGKCLGAMSEIRSVVPCNVVNSVTSDVPVGGAKVCSGTRRVLAQCSDFFRRQAQLALMRTCLE